MIGWLFPLGLHAQVWDGGAGTGNWGDANNWSTNAVPGSGANVAFAGTLQTTVNLGANRGVGTLTFNSGAGAFTLNDFTLTIKGSLTNNSANLQTINSAIVITNSNWTVSAATGSLAISGGVSMGGSRTLTVTGAFDTTLSGNLNQTGSSLKLTKSGTGTLTLSGVNNHTGAVTIGAGTLVAANSSALGTTKSGTTVNSGGTLALSGGIAIGAEALTFSGVGAGGTGALRNISGDNSYGGALKLGAASTIASEADSLTLSGNLDNRGFTATFTGAGNINAGGIVSGNGGLVKNGAGTLTLSRANTYAGATTINAGTLVAANSAALGTTGSGTTVASGGTLGLSGGVTIAGEALSLAGAGMGGAGALRSVSGDNTYGGAITQAAAATIAADADTSLALSGTLANGGFTSTFTGAGDIVVNGVVSGTGALVKNGAGTLTLNAADTYAGGTSVNAGTLVVGGNTAVGTGTLTLGTATVQATGGTRTLANAVALAGNTTFGGSDALVFSGATALTATRTLVVNNVTTFGGVVSGSGFGLTLDTASTGTLVLSGANTYTGATTLNGGTLMTAAANILGNTSGVAIASGAVLDLNGYGQSVASVSGAGAITLGAATLTTGGSNTSSTFSGVISGTGGLTKSGTGTFTLSGLNTYAGATTVNVGSLAAGATQAFSDNSAFTVASGASVNLAGYNQAIGSLAGAGGVSLGGAALTAGDNNASTSFSGVVSGAGSFTKEGAGTLTLSGAHTFTGPLAINEGSLVLSGAAGAAASATALTVGSGATLSLDNAAANNANRISDSASVSLAGGSLAFTSNSAGSTETVGALNAGSGNSRVVVNQTGSGAAVLTFSSLGTIASDASVDFGATGGTLGAVATGPQIYIGGLGAGFVGGWATVGSDFAEYSTFGVRALTGYYTLGDGINVNNSTANILLASSSPATAYTLTNAGTTTDGSLLLTDVALVDLNTSATRTLNLASGGLLKTTSTATTLAGSGRLSAGGVADGTLSVTVQSTGALTIASSIVNNAGADGIYGNGDDGAVKLTKGGAGELILNVANTHSGGTQLDAGTLTLGNNAAAGTGTLTLGTATLQAGGGARTLANAVVLAGDTTFAGSNALSFTAPATLTGNRTLTTAVDVTFSGALGESGGVRSLTKNGAGILTFSGSTANTYTGVTTVNAGELRLAKTSGNAIAGALVIGDGSGTDTVRLAASNQIADTAAVTLRAGGVLAFDGFSDTIGSLTMAGGSAITTGAGTLTLGGNVTHDGTGSTAATFSGKLNLGGVVRTFNIADSAASNDLDLSAIISNGGITKTGAGTLLLGGVNTYTGATTVSAGTLLANAAGALGSGSAVTIATGAAVNFANFNQSLGSLAGAGSLVLGSATLTTGSNNTSTTFSGVVSGTGAVVKNGTGTQTFSGANTYTGATTINAGTLVAAHATALGTTAAGTTVTSGATLGLSGGVAIGSEALSLAGVGVGGNGALRNLSGSNSYAGAITQTAAATIAADLNTSLTLSGTLATGGFTTTFGGAGDISSTGIISGSGGAIIKTGAGTVTLSGANSYTGATTINTGTLVAAHATALGTTAAGTTVNSGGTLGLSGGITIGSESLALAGAGAGGNGALRNLSGNNTYGGAITQAAAATITSDANTLTLSGALANGGFTTTFDGAGATTTTATGIISGSGGLTKDGDGTLTLGAASTYTGATNVLGGTVIASVANTLGVNTAVTIELGATVNLNNFTHSFGSLAGDGSLGLGSATLTTGANNTSTTFAGDIGGTGGIIKNGTGTQTFSGANTYTGTTTVNTGGTLIAASDTALGTTGAGTTVNSGGTLGLSGDTDIGTEALTLAGTGVGGAGALRSFSGINSYAGVITQTAAAAIASDADTLTLSGNLVTGGFATTFTGDGDIVSQGVISGTGAVIKNGAGTVTLAGADNYTGVTTINAGTLIASHATALGTSGAGTTVNSGGTLGLSGGVAIGAETLSLSGSGVGGAGALRNLSGTNSYAGNITLATASTVGSDAGTLTLSGTVNTSGLAATFTGAGDITATNVVSGTSGSVIKNGAGTLTFSGANSYTGATTINTGTLLATNATALGTTATGTTVNSGGTLGLSGGIAIGAEALSLAGAGSGGTGALRSISGNNTYGGAITQSAAATIASDANTLTLSGTLANNGYATTVGGAGNVVVNGALSGSGSLTKNGAGTLTLGGNNSGFSGAFVVSGGALIAAAADVFNSGNAITIATGATLDLNNQTLTVGSITSSGTLALGAGTGDTLTLAAGASTFGGTLTGASTIIINAGASLTLDASFNNSAINFVLNGGSLYLGSGTTQIFGSLTVTGGADSVIDFGTTGATVAQFSSVDVTGAGLLHVQNWSNAVDFFLDATYTGDQGVAPNTQIVFTGFTGADTKWMRYVGGNGQITPVPEPSTYGAILLGGACGLVGWVRRRRGDPKGAGMGS